MRSLESGQVYDDWATTFIKNTALRFLQIVYAQKKVGDHHYDHDDVEVSEIKIADQFAYQMEANETKPAIIAVRGPLQWQNLGMNQGMQEQDRITGQTQYTDLITGSVGFSCLSRVGLEAEFLASEVFSLFRFFGRTLARHGFFSIKSMSIGSEQLIEAHGDTTLYLVSVMLTCQVQKSWTLEPKAAAELKKIVIQGLTKKDGSDEDIEIFKAKITDNDDGGGS